MNMHQLQLKKPLAVFDIETTGLNVATDRIIELAIIKALPGGKLERFETRLNPEIPISKESSLVHGIYNEDVADKPTFKEKSHEFSRFLEGCDLAGFNILNFDLPVLVEEFLRCNQAFDTEGRSLLDAHIIFRMMEPRSLAAACKFYLNKSIDTFGSAHNAMVDTEATLAVIDAQMSRYKDQEVPEGKIQGQKASNEVSWWSELVTPRMVDFANRMVLDPKGTPVFNFGKHKGVPVEQVLKTEPSYFDWMMKGDFTLDTKRKLTQIRLKMVSR